VLSALSSLNSKLEASSTNCCQWRPCWVAVGGILGDEMGLGKTVQIAAFLGALQNSGSFAEPHRVSADLLRQWVRELRRWVPRAATCHSAQRRHRASWAERGLKQRGG